MMLHVVAWSSLAVAIASFLLIALDETKYSQKMWIMNLVWPITALYFSVFAVAVYFGIGRRMARDRNNTPENKSQSKAEQRKTAKRPTWSAVAVSASHCGAGCTLADILCEYTVFALALTLFGQSLFASYILDLAVAWLFGIAFQYFMIKSMKQLTPGAALRAAIKADTLSILGFQAGMYGWMALVYFVLWPRPHLQPNQPTFWFMMQIAMIFGFLTTLPVNHWLVRSGLKESMV